MNSQSKQPPLIHGSLILQRLSSRVFSAFTVIFIFACRTSEGNCLIAFIEDGLRRLGYISMGYHSKDNFT
jgi:hypothetical protein